MLFGAAALAAATVATCFCHCCCCCCFCCRSGLLGMFFGPARATKPVNYNTKRLRSGLRPNPPPCLCKVTRTNIGTYVCLSVCLSAVSMYLCMSALCFADVCRCVHAIFLSSAVDPKSGSMQKPVRRASMPVSGFGFPFQREYVGTWRAVCTGRCRKTWGATSSRLRAVKADISAAGLALIRILWDTRHKRAVATRSNSTYIPQTNKQTDKRMYPPRGAK